MGPRRHRRGDMAFTFAMPAERCGKPQWGHGVTAVETWSVTILAPAAILSPQWGHGVAAVETLAGGLAGRGVVGAAMGPRRHRHGNRDESSRSPTSSGEPQWSHDVTAVETWTGPPKRPSTN